MDVAIPVSMETAKMYISEPQNGHTTTKYASTNSIPAMMEQESSLARILGAVGRHRENAAILRDTKTRRHSVLEDLKARRDSLIQRARRVSMFEEKENSAKDAVKDTVKIDVKDSSAKEKAKDKRRGSESGRRGSVFYVSEDLLEENQEVLENEDRDRLAQEAKKARRKSWHPLVKPPKLDRKRRKGVVSAVPSGVPSEIGSTEGLFSPNYPRQKRPSWWNIFIPESRYLYRDCLIIRLLRANVSTRCFANDHVLIVAQFLSEYSENIIFERLIETSESEAHKFSEKSYQNVQL